MYTLEQKCTKQILVRKTFKPKFITEYQKQNLKQDIRTIKTPSTTKSTKIERNFRMNSGKSKLQKTSQPVLGGKP